MSASHSGGSASAPKAVAGAPEAARKFKVKLEGGESFVSLLSYAEDVSDLLEEAAKRVAVTEHLSFVTLLASTDKTCTALAKLDTAETVASELARIAPGYEGPWFIVVRPPAAADTPIFRPQVKVSDAFVELLTRAGVRTEPTVLQRIFFERGSRLPIIVERNDPAMAKRLYEKVKSWPSHATIQALNVEGYKINGLLHEHLDITTCFYGLEERVLKPLADDEHARLKALEAKVLAGHIVEREGGDKLLRAAPHLAPFFIHEDLVKKKNFLIMPRYGATLEQVASFSPADAARVWADVSTALKHLHDLGFAHMDIKAANICISLSTAGCEVIDHGSIAPFGDRSSSTLACIPPDVVAQSKRASATVDWWMFAVLLAEKACGAHGINIGQQSVETPNTAALRAHLVEHCVLSPEAKADLLSMLIDPPARST